MEMETERYLEKLFAGLYRVMDEWEAEAFCTDEPVPFAERESGKRLSLTGGTRWGRGWDCAWIRLHGRVPTPAPGEAPALLLDVGGEACLYDGTGLPLKGFTNVQSEFTVALGKPAKQVWFPPETLWGKEVTLWADAGANDLFGAKPESGIFLRAEAALCSTEARALYYDLEVLACVADAAAQEDVRAAARNCFARAYERRDVPLEARAIAAEFLRMPSESGFTVTALGHAHLDLAWLWPLRETRRKAIRTFSTLVSHMSRYPDYVFGVSQPQLLQWVKEDAPALYGRLRELHAAGRLEIQGGFWVEADTNLPDGESLVRQLLYGMRFWKEEFGQTQTLLWLPDVFGYSAQLPQLMKRAGLPYFLTIKLSWNAVNRFPYTSFRWEGADGSEVLAHMPPEGNYNSAARADSLRRTESGCGQKEAFPGAMLLYGIGDGGGGPGMEHLERLAREKNLRGLPKVKQAPAKAFFAELQTAADRLPVWKGELYLEKHQGTYTSQARTKAANRACERALHELELLGAMAIRLCAEYRYPKKRVEALWKEVLLYQFHDILPGSCIARVYREAEERYGAMLRELAELQEEAYSVLLHGEGVSVFNPTSFSRRDAVQHDGDRLFGKTEAAPLCFTPFERRRNRRMSFGRDTLENSRLRLTFLPDGSLGSVFLKSSGREFLRAPGNRLAVYRDEENAWEIPAPEAWGRPYPMKLTSVRVSQRGGALVRTCRYTCGKSVIRQQVVLQEGSERIDFVTEVDWRESHRLLRADFPVAVRSETALCGIQFGAVRRPTVCNTSWEQAKREVCFHKYTDLSDDLCGAAVLSDEKYGVCVRDGVLSLTLLRSPEEPGRGADLGTHRFTYAFLPHDGGAEAVLQPAYALAYPLRLLRGRCSLTEPFVTAGELCVETVKPSEDGTGVIIRLYQPRNADGRATVQTAAALGFTRCFRTDLLEQEEEELALSPTLSVGPYEIVTLKFC